MLSTHTKYNSDTLSNNIVTGNIKNITRNVPIYISTIQKSVPTSTGTTSTKNNMIVGNEIKK